MAKIRLGPILILGGIIAAFVLGGTTVLSFAPWWVWVVILLFGIFFIGGKK